MPVAAASTTSSSRCLACEVEGCVSTVNTTQLGVTVIIVRRATTGTLLDELQTREPVKVGNKLEERGRMCSTHVENSCFLLI